jgi:uncharacterized protein YndB with AHSA1/START domain
MTVTTLAPVRKTVTVNASPARAFEVFTARFGDWWPLAGHHTAEEDAATAIIEPYAGGRWFERGVNGTETMWGYVTAWEPPARLVLAWHLDPDFTFEPDPAKASEVEVSFIAEGPTTRVVIEHRKLEVYGDKAAGLRTSIDSPGGWGAIIEEFARLVG